MNPWLLAAAIFFGILPVLALALSLCKAAARGDEIMEEFQRDNS